MQGKVCVSDSLCKTTNYCLQETFIPSTFTTTVTRALTPKTSTSTTSRICCCNHSLVSLSTLLLLILFSLEPTFAFSMVDQSNGHNSNGYSSNGHSSSLPPKLDKISRDQLPANLHKLVETAKQLYVSKILSKGLAQNHHPPAFIVAAPGRVNLIGEHTDYTGGFVLPLAIDRSTVVYGTGYLHTGKGTGTTTVRLRFVSAHNNNNNDDDDGNNAVEEFKLTHSVTPPDADEPKNWTHYVVGVVAQYLQDLPVEGCVMDLCFAVASDVPLNAGLSSSASLEVAVATLVECFFHQDLLYSGSSASKDIDTTNNNNMDNDNSNNNNSNNNNNNGDSNMAMLVEKALRCQRAENEWAHAPCGIMDQLASCAGQKDKLVLIDCRSLEVTHVPMKKTNHDMPVILVTNSHVSHSIGDGEYGKRRKQCNDALNAMQSVPLYHVLSLRDATLADCQKAKSKMDEIAYKRAVHVVSENSRVTEAKVALKMGLWDRVGELMNASHASLRDDFEVSCEEIDFLVQVAQSHEGVYGSRITGGGFGGCTVTLVQKDAVDGLIAKIQQQYKEKYNKDADCFVVTPSAGARRLAIDMHCRKERDSNGVGKH